MTETKTKASIEAQIKAGRAALVNLRKDISQIKNMGVTSTEKKEHSHISCFKSMYPRAAMLLSDYMSKFEATHTLAILNESESSFPCEDDFKRRNEVNSYYYKIVEIYREFETAPSSLESNRLSTSFLNSSLGRARLPTINLPKFTGTISEWPKFKLLFSSVIHDNSELPTIQKFHYLASSLSGEPLALISAFSITDENYAKAWQALLKRYDNQRLLATSYIEKVFDFSPLRGPPTLQSLQSFSQVIFENVAALKSIQLPDEADILWLTFALRKLDPHTRKRFEECVVDDEWPTFEQLIQFIQGRCKALQLSECCNSKERGRTGSASSKSRVLMATDSRPMSQSSSVCSCRQQHPLYECPVFRDKSPGRRRAFLSGKQVCYNCLKPGHLSPSCPSTQRCRSCSKKHHTLLHFALSKRVSANPNFNTNSFHNQESSTSKIVTSQTTGAFESPVQRSSNSLIASVTGPGQILLGTAVVLIADSVGQLQPVRLLVDCGSQLSLMTVNCAKRLGLTWQATTHRPLGAGQVQLPQVKGSLRCEIHSRLDERNLISVKPLVVTTITGDLPTTTLTRSLDSSLDKNLLADPGYWKPSPIDFLLGNDFFMSILTGPVRILKSEFGALSTIFGYILMGNIGTFAEDAAPNCLSLIEAPLSDELITRFWDLEKVEHTISNEEDEACEEFFRRTHYREPDGRYVVALPFKPGIVNAISPLSESHDLALARFQRLEGRMRKNPTFKSQYTKFMDEYENLGHMSISTSPPVFVIPHHGVFRANEENTRIRVVFDASIKTSAGSLNDWMIVGPKFQRDVGDIIMSFRTHAVAFTTDLVKMYRQVLVVPEDRRFQCIWWRSNEDEAVQLYELNTVTYGEVSSPYLALRAVKQLIIDEGKSYPFAAKVLNEDIYVDDIVSGADTVENAIILKDELISLLGKGQFVTHKWKTNSVEFLRHLGELGGISDLSMEKENITITKILGLSWNPTEDVFLFDVNTTNISITKRGILSTIARLYDPMGFLSPVIFQAKCIMQLLWCAKLNWDERPEDSVCKLWEGFAKSLPSLSEIRIPRFSLFFPYYNCQLVGFCDASQKGYAAVMYLRVVSGEGQVKVTLLKSKTRVAPLRTVSIPRLELCGAHLLTKLLISIQPLVDKISISDVFLFTDSMIVLSWLRISPHTLQTFVANRVSFIVSHTVLDNWRHVTSGDNPADAASRGLMPHQLKDDPLWWAGPAWLSNNPLIIPSIPNSLEDIPELRSGVVTTVLATDPWLITWMDRHSKYGRMIRTLAYVLRFVSNLKTQKFKRVHGALSLDEINSAEKICIRDVQRSQFASEFDWHENKPISRRLLELATFLDQEGVLRVGGRLTNANISFETKSPIILPGKCHFTSLLIDHLHVVNFHLGNMALQSLLRRRFWIFRLRQVVRSRLIKCMTCFRHKAQPISPLMGDLPSSRVRQGRPFLSVGLDYAGPFHIKQSARRNAPRTKAYLCLFVCMSTKAVHLECVSSLSTDAFLASLDRLIARRGIPIEIYSDCGRNFVGAARRLRELFSWLNQQDVQTEVSAHATKRGFRWRFNPPYAPHFGGLWEAAVKSVKYHMNRVIKDQVLTFEEMATFFARVEAILNSRPIGGNDPCSDPLTPGHFLIGAPLIGFPEEDISSLKLNMLSRWQLIQYATQHFWKRWHQEYLQTLQKRTKWFYQGQQIKVDDIVLLSDQASAPQRWPLARVIECHPGSDGIVRVVTVRDGNATRRTAVHKLVPLSQLDNCQ